MYETYINFINKILLNQDLSKFKSCSEYTAILEHVNPKQGKEYLSFIEKNTSIPKNMIKEFCETNDKIGNPILTQFSYFYASPTSLRYICHAHIILTYLGTLNLKKIDIVELGGGYGGLCLAIYYFSKFYNITINSYSIIDLQPVCELQKLYLKNFEISNINFIDSNTFGADIDNDDLFLISNYCFSEISNQLQQKYIKMLFPKVSHGFMVWNHIPVYNFGFKLNIEQEIPQTSNDNKYIYF